MCVDNDEGTNVLTVMMTYIIDKVWYKEIELEAIISRGDCTITPYLSYHSISFFTYFYICPSTWCHSSSDLRTMGRISMKSTLSALGHSLLHSLVRSRHSLICSLREARFALALRCALSFARSLAHPLTPELMRKWFMF